MSRNTTFVEIAKKLGVSHTTISRAYHGKDGVSEETRMRVMEAARDLNLALPSKEARAEAATLFLCIPSWEGSPPTTFISLMVKGIHDTLDNHEAVNYRFIPLDKLRQKESPEAVVRRLAKAQVVVFLQQSDPEIVKGLLEKKVHVILGDHEHEGVAVESVTSDNIAGGVMAARYLLERGHRKIGWINIGTEMHTSWEQRLMGVRAELAAWNLSLVECRSMGRSEDWPEETSRTAAKWVEEGTLPPAVIMPASHMAFSFERGLTQCGKQWGRDISLVCFDNDFMTTMCMTTPTRVATFPYEIGKCIVDQAVQVLSQPEVERTAVKHIVPVQLIEGKSVVTVG